MDFETRKVIVMGTMHLTPMTVRSLDHWPLDEWPVGGGRLDFGYYVYVGGEDGPPELIERHYSDLAACMKFAATNGFDCIQFDRDKTDAYEGLTDYSAEWEDFEARELRVTRLKLQRNAIEATGAQIRALPDWWATRYPKHLATIVSLFGEAMGFNMVSGDYESAEGALVNARELIDAALAKIADVGSDPLP